ncbi:MAG: 4-(cytidine 5'-diphospho)-2-C-methyl-D-erythritol kinase [Pseudomonadota bacterium]
MSAALTLLSPAKLNLFLHITARRSDGYHELQTLFQLVEWGDVLTFDTNQTGAITLQGMADSVPDKDNLIYRAAIALQSSSENGVEITIEKRIPSGAGLGGGSSNAATTLLALNQLWNCGKSQRELQQIGAQLGADVPIFVGGRTAWAEGIGEILTPVDLSPRWYVIISPFCHVNTGQIFSHIDLTRNTSPIKMSAFFEGSTRNDFQDLVRRLYPDVDAALTWLNRFAEARLTGSGSSVFASVETESDARYILQQMPDDWRGVTAKGLNVSPVIVSLMTE